MINLTHVFEDYDTKKLVALFCPLCDGQVFGCPDPACEDDKENAHHVYKSDCPDFSSGKMIVREMSPDVIAAKKRLRDARKAFMAFWEKWASEDYNAKRLAKLRSFDPESGEHLEYIAQSYVEEAAYAAYLAALGIKEEI